MSTRRERAFFVQTLLDQYIPDPKPSLVFSDSYTLLIAVLLSAQSVDARVNTGTPILFAEAKTPQDMARLDVEHIQKIIRPCGLSQKKAQAISALSKILADKYHGLVPKTYEELEALPGVGHKTAAVVLSQGFEIPAMPVDTHIYRCARRWGLSRGNNVNVIERDLKTLFPQRFWNRLHLQIILFARKYCPAKGHNPALCPICTELD